VKVPKWLIRGGSDITSEALLGMLALYSSGPDPELAETIGKLCDGLAEFQVRDKESKLYGAHPSSARNPLKWHHWGSRQTMALARANRVLKEHPNRARWLESARLEADTFYKRLLDSHVPETIDHDKVGEYPQIAYGTTAIVLGCLEVHRATGEKKYLAQAATAFSWYMGKNPPKVVMYDENSGRCFDGILDKARVNRNSGAESTIEALLALEELKQ